MFNSFIYFLIILILAGFITIFKLCKPPKLSSKALAFSSLCIALSIVLSFIKILQMPQGGSVALCSMVFISLIGYFYGAYWGILGGVVFGLIKLVMNPYIIHPIQFLLDYPLAFGCLGIAGFFKNVKGGLVYGFVTGVFFLFICAVMSGVIFFGEYAPEGQNVLIYSIVYNATYIVPEVILSLIVISLPPVKRAIRSIGNFS